MQCRMCGGCGYKIPATLMEKAGILHTLSQIRHGHPAAGVIPLVVTAAKEAFSQAYHCSCGHEWREWFE